MTDSAHNHAGVTLDTFIAEAQKNRDFWAGVRRTARVSAAATSRLRALRGTYTLLALAEDWCGDAVNTLPVLQRLVEGSARITLRLLRRDEHPRLMDAHLTLGTRSIPVVMVLDGSGRERGWWGPRPGPLQQWYYDELKALTKEERGRKMREWYARDRGETVVGELLALLEHIEAGAGGSSEAGASG